MSETARGPVDAVFFDVGETLYDESRAWATWADVLGVDTFTFFAVLGSVIERGEDHRQAFAVVRPGFDLDAELPRFTSAGGALAREDLFPDARPCLTRMREAGAFVGLVGNMPAASEDRLRELGLPVDLVASSARWGVEKPSPAFFQRMAREAGVGPGRVAHVGDRLDNDVSPAAEAGMVAVFLRRGPWARIQSRRVGIGPAHVTIDSLEQLHLPMMEART